MRIPCCVIGLLLGLALPASAQLTRVANTTLDLPADLPSATGYTVTENALGSLTFSAPICVTHVAGETNRLFVVERNNGLIQQVNLAGAAPVKNQWFSLASIVGPGESRRTDFENGFFSMALHPQFASNGVFCVFYSLQVSEAGTAKLFQRIHWVKVNDPAATTATLHSHRPLITQLDEASALETLRMATVGGSTALGQDSGVLAAGRLADLIAVDVDQPKFAMMDGADHGSVLEFFLYQSNGNDVALNVVNGDVVLRDGRLTKADEGEIADRVAKSLSDANQRAFGH